MHNKQGGDFKMFLASFRVVDGFEDGYLADVPAVKYLREYYFKEPVTFFCGENGTGKSTLLEALAVASGYNAEGGTRNMMFSTHESHSSLYKNMKIARSFPFARDGFFLRAESFYNVATEIEHLDKISIAGEVESTGFIEVNYGGKSMHKQSHGESFMNLALNRFRGKSLFFLDEPEAALSATKQMSILCRINELVKDGSQFIIATHSPILTSYPQSEIIEFTINNANIVKYKDTENYTITKYFLNNPDEILRNLFQR